MIEVAELGAKSPHRPIFFQFSQKSRKYYKFHTNVEFS